MDNDLTAVASIPELPFDLLPQCWAGPLRLYVQHGLQPSGLLLAILRGNLSGAMAAAQPSEVAAVPALFMFIQEYLPIACCGNRAIVDRWTRLHQQRDVAKVPTFLTWDVSATERPSGASEAAPMDRAA